jgi:hypothetical protein
MPVRIDSFTVLRIANHTPRRRTGRMMPAAWYLSS